MRVFSQEFREALKKESGVDPQIFAEISFSDKGRTKTALLRSDKYTLESILDFIEKTLPWMSLLYLKYPVETFVLKKTLKSLLKKTRKDIEKKKKKRMLNHPKSSFVKENDMSVKQVLSKIVSIHLNEKSSASVKRLSNNRHVLSNFTDEKLDYKSPHDFWEVDGDYIVRNFEAGEIIDESN